MGNHLKDCLVSKKCNISGGHLTISSGFVIEGVIETSDKTFYIERGGMDELVLDTVENRRALKVVTTCWK